MPSAPLPAFVNLSARNAPAVLNVLRQDPRVEVRETSPDGLAAAVSRAVWEGFSTIIVAGGDGTVSTAAGCVVHTPTALCILCAGTLNHFARRLGVPADPRAALELAFSGDTTNVDVGWVNDRLFLNTSVVGLYVDYVRRRERLKRWIGRSPASFVAAGQSLVAHGNHRAEVEIDGERRAYRSLLFFAAVGEREFRIPVLGELKEPGRRGLHVVAVPHKSRLRLLTTALRMATTGIRPWPARDHDESFIVESCRVYLRHSTARIALDGEIARLSSPLTYRVEPGALLVRTIGGERSHP